MSLRVTLFLVACAGFFNTDERLTVTIPEAARLLGISRNSAYQAASRGEIPTVRVGRLLLVPVARLRALLGEGEESA